MRRIVLVCLVLLASVAVFRPRPNVVIDEAMRAQAIDRLVAGLNQYYVFPDQARQAEALLRQRQKDGAYDCVGSGMKLARLLEADLASVVHDRHLGVGFSLDRLPPREAPTSIAQDAALEAPREESNAALRWRYRASGESAQFRTQDKLEGQGYGGRKPVLILAGPRTGSAGEDFTCTMQALKRATVIGERTWGGAHPLMSWRLGDHLYAAIPAYRSISPITHANWEGTGVIPDVAAPSATALGVAKALLQRRHGAAG